MSKALDFIHGNLLFNLSRRRNQNCSPIKIVWGDLGFGRGRLVAVSKKKCSVVFKFSSPVNCKLFDYAERSIEEQDATVIGGKCITFPHVQTLRDFSEEDLFNKVVMVRFDPIILLPRTNECPSSSTSALFTIKYLHKAGAKVILVSSWTENTDSCLPSTTYASTKTVADLLSSVLELNVVVVRLAPRWMDRNNTQKSDVVLLDNLSHVKGELANCPKFSKELASGIDIIVNDAFSQSHKALASTVGIACFAYAYIAGFYFEEELYKMKKIVRTSERPYFAIIGGGNLADKAPALRFLTSICDTMVFVGSMAFQILHALGVPVPAAFVELGALKEAVSIVESAKSRNIQLVLPKDFYCINHQIPRQFKIFSINSILEDWRPVDIGPRSLQEIINLVSKAKEIIWIGPPKYSSSKQEKDGIIKLAEELCTGNDSRNVTFVGKVKFEDLVRKIDSLSNVNLVKNAAVVWQVLKGRKLPGLMALDRAYPFRIDWAVAFDDPRRPLVVDVGSGNGLFLFGMARKRGHMNYLGLELNSKLVDRCQHSIPQFGFKNIYFINTNATSTFRSIVSSYPGKLVLVSIQCPNPDFNRPEYRWRMLQRSLIEAISDLLIFGGKVFLQSDIESVATRMKEEFMKYGKGKLVPMYYTDNETTDVRGWLKENPLGVPSDWEQHVLDRGDPMYRCLFVKRETEVDEILRQPDLVSEVEREIMG